MQLREAREFCEGRKWNFQLFADPGWSGAKEHRPELDRMMALIRRRKFDVVVVYRFDRFARSTKQLVNALDEFQALGIQFVSLHEAIDTTTPTGRLAFHIFAAIAEFERELARERVRSGLANARAKGKVLGRPRVLADRNRIVAMRDEGLSWRTIGRMLGINHETCRRLALASKKLASEQLQ